MKDNLTQVSNNVNNIPTKDIDMSKKSHFKCGFVSIIGRPSVGKSSFLNYLCGENTAITSVYPQTTRSIIRGIVTRDTFQIIFLDTPGLHFSDDIFGTTLRNKSTSTLRGVDAVLYMLDLSRPPKDEEIQISKMLSKQNHTIIVCNKTDVKTNHKQNYQTHLQEYLPNQTIHYMSVKKKTGIETLLTTLATFMPEGKPLYPAEYYTDQSPEMRMCEQVRAVAIENLYQEIPYALYTHLLESSIKNYNPDGTPKHIFVRIEIVVETDNQLRIVVGKGGAFIKNIRIQSSKRITKLFDFKVQLELRVAVQKKWRKNSKLIIDLANR